MSIRRITISVPSALASRIKKAAGAGSVSSWVTSLIEEKLNEGELEKLWEDFLRRHPPRAEDVRRADALFRSLTKPKRRKRAA